jgi:hypothetical protein
MIYRLIIQLFCLMLLKIHLKAIYGSNELPRNRLINRPVIKIISPKHGMKTVIFC